MDLSILLHAAEIVADRSDLRQKAVAGTQGNGADSGPGARKSGTNASSIQQQRSYPMKVTSIILDSDDRQAALTLSLLTAESTVKTVTPSTLFQRHSNNHLLKANHHFNNGQMAHKLSSLSPHMVPHSPESLAVSSPSVSLCGSNSSSPPLHYAVSPQLHRINSVTDHSTSESSPRLHELSALASPPSSATVTVTEAGEYLSEPPKPFICSWKGCKKAFPRKADLTRHERIHQNIRPFVCTFDNCGKAFSQRSALKVHVRIHTGEKPHVCPYEGCHKSFSDSSSLARHRKLHTTDGMTYFCDHPECGMKFSKKIFMLRHRKAAHGSASAAGQTPNSYPSPVSLHTSPTILNRSPAVKIIMLPPTFLEENKSNN